MNMSLLKILGLNRPANSNGESILIDHLLSVGFKQDDYGNLYILDKESSVAFTAHTDTVSKNRVLDRQFLEVVNGVACLADKSNGCVLGADDGTGVYILLELLRYGVKGNYFIFRDEETGRQGSQWFKDNCKDLYSHVTKVISFDRMGYSSVITHQMGYRCCSDEFAKAFGKLIKQEPDDTGSFTDSYSFMDVIPECTNIAVGYHKQHTSSETQDLGFAENLVDMLVDIDFESLPVSRDPKVVESAWDDYMDKGYSKFESEMLDMEAEEYEVFDELVYTYQTLGEADKRRLLKELSRITYDYSFVFDDKIGGW